MQLRRLASPTSARWTSKPETREELSFGLSPRPSAGRSLSSSERSVFFPLRPSTLWIRLTNIVEDNLLYSKSMDVLILSKNTFIETSGIMCDQICGYHGPVKLTHGVPIIDSVVLSGGLFGPTCPSRLTPLAEKWSGRWTGELPEGLGR